MAQLPDPVLHNKTKKKKHPVIIFPILVDGDNYVYVRMCECSQFLGGTENNAIEHLDKIIFDMITNCLALRLHHITSQNRKWQLKFA